MRKLNPLIIPVLLFCAMGGLWGCSQQKTGAISNKIRELETRHAKLEEDYRTLHVTSEQNRKRLSAVEEQRTALETEKNDLVKQLESASTERETLRKQLVQRTQERDAAQNHLTQFSRDLQALAGRIDAAVKGDAANPASPIIPASRRNE